MNAKRRAFFGLGLAPLAGLSGAAVVGITTASAAKEYPLRGRQVNSWATRPELAGYVQTPVYSNWTLMRLQTNLENSQARAWDSARMVEVDIGGKREYVMTFEKSK